MNTEIQITMHTQNITKPRWTDAPLQLSSRNSLRQKKNGLKSVKTPNGDIMNSFSTVLNEKTTLLMAHAVFSRLEPLLVLMILDRSSRAASRCANVIVVLGDKA